MKPLKEKISITVDRDILEKIKQEAEKDDRSLSQYINVVLKEHIKSSEKPAGNPKHSGENRKTSKQDLPSCKSSKEVLFFYTPD